MTSLPNVAIIELGSQYTLLIERTLRELGVRSMILDPKQASAWLKQYPVKAIILSGGAASVYENDAPQPPEEIFSLHYNGKPVHVLGICYGMQWIAHHFHGEVKPVLGNREYGETEINLLCSNSLFYGSPDRQKVWASHGDSVVKVPERFSVVGSTATDGIAAMVNDEGTVWGVQFHPEVTHTPHGKVILGNFLRLAGCEDDWRPASLVASIRENVLSELGDRKAIFGFSGGVDSTTLSAILSPVLKERLIAVTIDGGHLREKELYEIHAHAHAAGVGLAVIDARLDFTEALADITDAEEKRRRFKKVYAKLLVETAGKFGATAVIQGTLAPDRIESGTTGGALIKSHHNVDLDAGKLAQLHPIGHLFKYEIRALAKELGLPESVWNRQPFPGPGLFIRIVGVPATPEMLDVVRWADAQTKEILEKHNLYKDLSQLVVAYLGTKTVGVKGDGRVYGGAVVVRAVQTLDFMTARGVHLPEAAESEICTVLTRHPQIVRVWFDPTKKPPATTELE